MRINKSRLVVRVLMTCVIGTFIPLACTMFTFTWFLSTNKADNQAIDGEVGLRDYFFVGDGYAGKGTQDKPYEIVYPTHFYNLTRLQNLGVFSDQTWFRLGHDFTNDDDPLDDSLSDHNYYCLSDLNDKDYTSKVSYLDMRSYCKDVSLGGTYGPLLPIGSEGTPFYGKFDGNLLPIVGLRVAGNPEDVGVFGYTSHSSEVKNLVFQDLEVTSLGYSTSGDSNFLYSEIIERIFDDDPEHEFEKAYLDLDEVNLKSTSIFGQSDLPTYLTTHDGIFTAHFPTIAGKNVEYSISSSTGVIKPVKDEDHQLEIDLSKLPTEFSGDNSVVMNSNISLVASVKIGGIKYSRVIQSYSIEIKKAPSIPDNPASPKKMSIQVKCNYVKDSSNNPINFNHGYNVGYIVGHADGKVEHCYVYNGTLNLNKDEVTLHKIDSQTETGLIGKIGNNVTTDIDPTSTSTTKGETGVLNFSYIYSLIRRPFSGGEEVYAGYQDTWNGSAVSGNPKSFITYAVDEEGYGPTGVSDTFDLYKEYLRTDTSIPKNYITYAGAGTDSAFLDLKGELDDAGSWYLSDYEVKEGKINKQMNSVDLTWNKVICDGGTPETKRGMGVFKIVTASSSLPGTGHDSDIWRNNIGDFAITDDVSATKNAIYYSTAECDWTKGLTGWNTIKPAIMNTLPTYSNTGSFEYPFSRDFNYLFKIGLSAEESAKFITGTEMKNYFYNTTSGFLSNYLSSKLITRENEPVEKGTKAFGFKVQFSQDIYTGVDKLTSYLTVGDPMATNQKQFTVNGETAYYPQKSIVFSIHNAKGANVSIAGCDGDISIYRYNPDSSDKPVELYTMYSRQDTEANLGRAFEYQHDCFEAPDDEINTKEVVTPQGGDMKRTNYLYGHTFKLPYGNYVIGSSHNTGYSSAKVYYVCVQGQTNGDLGELEVATIGNYIRDVDFLLKSPVTMDGSGNITGVTFNLNDTSAFAKFSFNGVFKSDIGKMVVDAINVSGTNYTRVRFNNFINYLLFYCRKNSPAFKINEENEGALIVGEATYDGPYTTFTTTWS